MVVAVLAKAPHLLLEDRHLSAVEAVKSVLGTHPEYVQVEETEVLPLLSGCSVVWRRKLHCNGSIRTVDVGLPRHFPDTAPVACVHEWEDLVGSNPHIENQGLLCVIPESASIDSTDPVGLVTYVFESAYEIINGTDQDDFREEFSYYWQASIDKEAKDVVLVDSPTSLQPITSAAIVKDCIFIGSSLERLKNWLGRITGKSFELEEQIPAFIISIQKPLHPREYPYTVTDLVTLANANDIASAQRIIDHIVKKSSPAVAILVQEDGGVGAIAAVTFKGLQLSKIRLRDENRGFRPGMTPSRLLFNRCTKRIEDIRIERNIVSRADHEQVHTRGGNGMDLSQKSIVLIGGGSLGGYVAHLIAKAGVDNITIIDKEKLRWENIGRHILGASFVGQWKAEAIASELSRQMPHLTVNGISEDWRDYLAKDQDFFNGYDLVVSTVADWRSEAPLNTMARQAAIPRVLFGWLEPFAVAGHCLLIETEGGCFQCAANAKGQFEQRVSEFKNPTLSKDSSGCTHYQKYGPIAVLPVASLIATTAIDSLIESFEHSQLHTWISSEEHFCSVGASFNDKWSAEINKSGYNRIMRREWMQSSTCPICA